MIDMPVSRIWNVSFLFNPTINEVLMAYKNRGPFPYHYNGVGGKYEDCKDKIVNDKFTNMKFSAIREIKEETGHEIQYDDLKWLTTLVLPSENFTESTRERRFVNELWVYYGIVEKDKIHQIEDEKLKWIKVDNILNIPADGNGLAGDGNIQYFITLARKNIGLMASESDLIEN